MRNQVEWDVPPKTLRQVDVQKEKDTSRKNHAAKEDDSWGVGETIVRDAAKKADHVKATTELRAVLSTISGHAGRTHARTYEQRAQLEKILADLLKQFPEEQLTLKRSAFIASQINVKRNSFPE